jgi:transcriptional regulator with XRE-family HTH domain
MTLIKYLKSNRMTETEFAKHARLSVSQISQVITGIRQPSFNSLIRIHNATNGRVTFADLAGPRLVTYKE